MKKEKRATPRKRAFLGLKDRVLTVDWSRLPRVPFTDEPVRPASGQVQDSAGMHRKLREQYPYEKLVGRKRRYERWEDLDKAINDYFESCNGPLIGKRGYIMGPDGKPIIGQVRPYTISGLCFRLDLLPSSLDYYLKESLAGRMEPEYAEIISRARLRIEEYWESQLADYGASRGAQFALQCRFGWKSDREQVEIQRTASSIENDKQALEIRKKESDAKLKLLGTGKDSNEVKITITRAGDD